MSAGPYEEARSQVGELLRRYERMDDARRDICEHLGRHPAETATVEMAVATRLVALLTKGMEMPSTRHTHWVLAPNGRRIEVFAVIPEYYGLGGGKHMRLDSDKWDEVALVAFEAHTPVVVHIIDKESVPALQEHLGVSKRSRFSSSDFSLSALLHYNLMMEPTVAEVLGVRTFILDEEERVGWHRVTLHAE